MLNREELVDKMSERGFTEYSTIKTILGTQIHFVSSHMYNPRYKANTPPRERKPIINIIVDLEKDEFKCVYNVSESINTLNTPSCGSVLNDEHFDRIVGKFELHAKCLERTMG